MKLEDRVRRLEELFDEFYSLLKVLDESGAGFTASHQFMEKFEQLSGWSTLVRSGEE